MLTCSQKLIPQLDRHLAIPLVNYLADSEIFPVAQVSKAQCVLLRRAMTVSRTCELTPQI